MASLVDPRTGPTLGDDPNPAPTTPDLVHLERLHVLCHEGRLYEVERWIGAGHPLQIDKPPTRGRRPATALSIALDQGNHALTLLLLCNGYDPDRESHRHLDAALVSRRPDLVELLLSWGANPHRVDLETLFGTYSSALFERFYGLGVDLTRRHGIARALGYHTSNKPLYGLAKRHRNADPAIARDLNAALAHHAYKGNEKGALLCLWAGADPHAPCDPLPYSEEVIYDPDDDIPFEDLNWTPTALRSACSGGHADLVERFGPDPERDDFDDLYLVASNPATVDVLARYALPVDVNAVVEQRIESADWRFSNEDHVGALRRLFEHGARWARASNEALRVVRRNLFALEGHDFQRVVLALATPGACAPEILCELSRTPAFERRLNEAGHLARNRQWHLRRNADQIAAVALAFRPDSAAAKKAARRAMPHPSRIDE